MYIRSTTRRPFGFLVKNTASTANGQHAARAVRADHNYDGIVTSHTYVDIGGGNFCTIMDYRINAVYIDNILTKLHPDFYHRYDHQHDAAVLPATAKLNLQNIEEMQWQLAVAPGSACAPSGREHNERNLFTDKVVSRAECGQIVGFRSVFDPRREFLEQLIQCTPSNSRVESHITMRTQGCLICLEQT